MARTCRLSCLALAFMVAVATPALADSYLSYTQGGIPPGADIFTWCDAGGNCDMQEVVACDNPEGGTSLRTRTNIWAGWGVFLNIDGTGTPQPQDLSAFQNGQMRFFVKAPKPNAATNVKVEFQCRPAVDNVTYTKFLSNYGWTGSNTWQQFTIPIADFFAPNPVDLACLQKVVSPFMITIADLPFFNTFYADYARWETTNSHSGASSVQVDGRKLLVDGEPFVVNAISYAPVGVGENWQAAWRDRPDRYSVDFPAIANSGANAVRLYAPILTKAMLDAAWAEGLYVIPTFGVDSIQLECAAGRDFMKDRFVEMVNQWKDHPAILFWLVGNEVNVNLGAADLCLDWYPQLDAMAQAAHTAEGPSFHPVGTANADSAGLGDVCQVNCSDDTALPNVDLWGVQIYRGCSFGSVFDDYAAKPDCARPLVVTEFGADAYDARDPGEDQAMQADCLGTLLSEADQALAVRSGGVSSGQIIFEWTDEWWKAECDPGTAWTTHDTCASRGGSGYPDPDIHEEWWGLATLDDTDPDLRGRRSAQDRVNDAWFLGAVCNLEVVSYDSATGNATLSFDPGAGSTEHTLYYGPLNDVSSYGYTGSVGGLGATGSGSATLPAGSLFFVVVARNNAEEGCYGNDSGNIERPRFSGSGFPQAANRTCVCP